MERDWFVLDLHQLSPGFTPLVQFPAVCVYRSALVVLLPVNRQAFFFFPAAHRPHTAVQIKRDFLPGFQAVSRRDYFELGSRVQSLIYTPFSSRFPHAAPACRIRGVQGH